jgi:spore germination cell wall hydrolase CwlJ-like protein
LHYHANYANPKWAKKDNVVAVAGAHIFYRDIP